MVEISPKPLRLDNFIANLPCMAFQLVLRPDNSFSFSYIGDGSLALLGLLPEDLSADINQFLAIIHPEDSQAFTESMLLSAKNLTFWSWEGRVTLANGELKWLTLGSSP